MIPVQNIFEKNMGFFLDKVLIQSTLQPLKVFDCAHYVLDPTTEKKNCI